MDILKWFKKNKDVNYKVIDSNIDNVESGDSLYYIRILETYYSLELDWEDGLLDIEFGLVDDITFDITNQHVQYRILDTITKIIQSHLINNGIKVNTLIFASSDIRNRVVDKRSGVIRTKLFFRHVLRIYPNSTLSKIDNTVTINLNNI